MLERPFVPTFAFHVFLAGVALEGRSDVGEDVGKGSPHLEQTKHTTADNGTDGDGSNGFRKGDHLERSRTAAGVFLNGDVALLRGVVDGDVHEDRQRDKEEPTDDGAQVHEEGHTGFHEPANGEHRRCQRHPDVGVSKRVPRSLFRPVRLPERFTINGARGLVNLPA